MDLIVAVTENWGIGCKGNLLISIPDDMKFFRETTKGTVVVMGRETLESFPGKKPLKNRINIVLTRNTSLQIEGAVCLSDISRLPFELSKYPDKSVFVIGGESIYRQLLPYCACAYVTKMQALRPADKFFPNLDHEPGWILEDAGEILSYEGINYSFTKYVNTDVKSL